MSNAAVRENAVENQAAGTPVCFTTCDNQATRG
jgi:hypothetical protein